VRRGFLNSYPNQRGSAGRRPDGFSLRCCICFLCECMLRTMKTNRYFGVDIIAVVFFASVTVIGCSGIAEKQSSSDIATLSAACDRGTYSACVALGTKYLAGNGMAKDNSRALALFQRSCDGGNARGCALLGLMYDMGWGGVSKDVGRALELNRMACNAGSGLGCYNLGQHYETGNGVANDLAKAFALSAVLR